MCKVNGNFATDYLKERNISIEGRKKELIAKCNQNQLQIGELKDKILEIRDKYDETYEIFSPKPRTSEFSRTEMAVLAERQSELIKMNKKLEKEIKDLEEEQNKINVCLELISNGEVVSKTTDELSCIAQFYMDTETTLLHLNDIVIEKMNQMSSALKAVIRNHTVLKNVDKIIDETKNEIGNNIKRSVGVQPEESLENSIEEIVSKVNAEYNDRIGSFYKGDLENISDFSKNIIFKITKCILCNIVKDANSNVVLKLIGKEKYVNIIFEVEKEEELTIEIISNYLIGESESELSVNDLIAIANGEKVEFDDPTKKQLVIRI